MNGGMIVGRATSTAATRRAHVLDPGITAAYACTPHDRVTAAARHSKTLANFLRISRFGKKYLETNLCLKANREVKKLVRRFCTRCSPNKSTGSPFIVPKKPGYSYTFTVW